MSLRDVQRTLDITRWFFNQSRHLFGMMRADDDDEEEPDQDEVVLHDYIFVIAPVIPTLWEVTQ